MSGIEPADGRYQRTEAYYRAGNFTRCRDMVDQLLADHPQDSACLTLKGIVLLELDEAKEAIDAL